MREDARGFNTHQSQTTLPSLRDLLTQHSKKSAEAPAIGFNPRRKLVTQRNLHTHAADRHIGDPVLATCIDQIPIELDPATVGPNDVAVNDRFASIGSPRSPERMPRHTD